MLGKLLKYEIPALGRRLGPLFIAWAAASLLMGISIRLQGKGLDSDLLLILPILLYIGVTVAVYVMTIILIIQRYNKSLLGDEAYFNMVLPVTAAEHVMSKTISAFIWSFVAGIAAVISGLLIAGLGGAFAEVNFADVWKMLVESMTWQAVVIMIEIIIETIMSIVKSVLTIYAAVTIGHQAKKKPVLAAIGVYIGFSMVETTVGNILGPIIFNEQTSEIAWFAQSQKIVLFVFVILAIFTAVYFMICKYFLEKKLDLN